MIINTFRYDMGTPWGWKRISYLFLFNNKKEDAVKGNFYSQGRSLTIIDGRACATVMQNDTHASKITFARDIQ